jgi:hypothetical protein
LLVEPVGGSVLSPQPQNAAVATKPSDITPNQILCMPVTLEEERGKTRRRAYMGPRRSSTADASSWPEV